MSIAALVFKWHKRIGADHRAVPVELRVFDGSIAPRRFTIAATDGSGWTEKFSLDRDNALELSRELAALVDRATPAPCREAAT